MITQWPNQDLKTKQEEYVFVGDESINFAHLISKILLQTDSGGLSANQIGATGRVLAFIGQSITVMFNPKIVDFSEEESYLIEGCASNRGLFINIKRPDRIRVRYTEPNQNVVTKVFNGLTARIIQHQIDILDGVDFSTRATRYHLERARKSCNKDLSPLDALRRFAG